MKFLVRCQHSPYSVLRYVTQEQVCPAFRQRICLDMRCVIPLVVAGFGNINGPSANKPLLQSPSYTWLLLKCCCCYKRRPGIRCLLSLLHGESHLSNWMRLKVAISSTTYLLTQKKVPIKFLKIDLREISGSFLIRKNSSDFITLEMQTSLRIYVHKGCIVGCSLNSVNKS